MTALLLIPLRDGTLYAIYKDYKLCREDFLSGKSLDALMGIWQTIKRDYEVSQIFYARGPGSLSALKLLHIFVHTLAAVRDIQLFATRHFYFSDGVILAFGNQYFIQDGQEIVLKTYDEKIDFIPVLPERLIPQDFHEPLEPLYVLPAL